MTTIELPDEQAAALKAKAAAQGLTLSKIFSGSWPRRKRPRKLPPLLKKRPTAFSNCKSV